MTTDNPGGWPKTPGVPLNPEQIGLHWLFRLGDAFPVPFPAQWELTGDKEPGSEWEWRADGLQTPEEAGAEYGYLGPCLTPAEVAAQVAAAFADGFDAGFAASGEGWNGEYPGDAATTSEYSETKDAAIRARGVA